MLWISPQFVDMTLIKKLYHCQDSCADCELEESMRTKSRWNFSETRNKSGYSHACPILSVLGWFTCVQVSLYLPWLLNCHDRKTKKNRLQNFYFDFCYEYELLHLNMLRRELNSNKFFSMYYNRQKTSPPATTWTPVRCDCLP